MNRALFAAVLAAITFHASILPARADGLIGFGGTIVEPACPLREDATLACRASRTAPADIRTYDAPAARAPSHARLFAYALLRDAGRPWRLIEVTYR